jgi:hypothetical protein
MTPLRICLVLVIAAVFRLASASSSDFVVRASPLFEGAQAQTGFVPLQAFINNTGDDAVGTLTVSTNGYSMSYPVELPHNSEKQLVVYTLAGNDYSYSTTLDLRTNRGNVSKPVDPAGMTTANGDAFLEIGGHPGDLAFLGEISSQNPTNQPGGAYVSVEDAPDRLEAYSGLAMVILGRGSERLSDGAVRALRLYVLHGGLLVFTGGTVSPILSDGRWSGIFPAIPEQPAQFTGVSVLGSIAKSQGQVPSNGRQKPGPFSMASAYSVIASKPLSGAVVASEKGVNLITCKQYGFGTATFWAFDPFAEPLRDWIGRANFFRQSALTPATVRPASLPISTNPDEGNAGLTYRMSGGGSYSGGSTRGRIPATTYRGGRYRGYTPYSTDDGPFRVAMPSAARVGMILALYFVCVIPVNFIGLQLLKRRQLGWFTGALISFVFAAIMLSQARELYGLNTSHSDEVAIVGEQGSGTLVALAKSQIFVSNGGIYDLKMHGVDSASPAVDNYSMAMQSGQGLENFAPVDTGEVRFDSSRFSNLNFEELRYVQVLEDGDPAHIEETSTGYQVTSKTTLKDCALVTSKGEAQLGDLGPNQNAFVPFGKFRELPPDRGRGTPGTQFDDPSSSIKLSDTARLKRLAWAWLVKDRCALVANAPSLSVGPNVGARLTPLPALIFFADGTR